MTQFVTIVTGAGGALGSAVAARLLRQSHHVAGIDRVAPPRPRIESSAEYVGLALDVADLEAWRHTIADITSRLGAPSGAVLCAGGWAGGTNVADGEDETIWRRMLDMNLETAAASMRAVLPDMVAREQGSIVVVGSRAVERPWENTGAAAYAASKSALVSYAQVVAREVVGQRVRVNAVLPSTIDTPANRKAMPHADPSRWVGLDSLAGVIAFLLSDEARDISGAAIPVYGRA